MKALVASLLLGGVCIAVTATFVANKQAVRHRAELAHHQALWAAEKSQIEAALKKAKGKTVIVESPSSAPPVSTVVTVAAKPDTAAILERLQSFKPAPPVPGSSQPSPRQMKRILHEFESLVDAGEAALPAIRAFLDRNEDLDFQTAGFKGSRDGNVQTDFLMPPSLRLGLFDALRRIGGAQSEAMLADVLKTTARGVEVAYLARVLQEIAPNKHRDAAIAAAKDLLANPVAEAAALDKNDRNYLYGVLAFFNDSSQVAVAQGQLLAASGSLDRAALKYLERSMGEQVVSLVAQAYQDPRVTDPAAKEPLVRSALAFVGANDQALQVFGQAVRDPALQGEPIRNLVEDLNQDGIRNEKQPTPEDLKLIANRYALTQRYLQQDFVLNNKALLEGFREADKDLRNMLQRASAPPKPKP
ncbi:MAG: hypothetical protein HZA92_18205 [Verrucomicrobia bacterium]|nr:hypothetical protein [Verrucomicrobiota bacterium]